MKNLYLYPILRDEISDINPFVRFQGESLGRHFRIVNAGKPSKIGIFDLIRYVRKTDILFLNWIEELPDKHRGIIQSLFFLLFLHIRSLFRIRIVWTLHNKKSHFKKHRHLKNMLFNQMLKKSDLIITHAEEGLEYVSGQTPSAFIHHPVRLIEAGEKIMESPGFDIIIWGNIAPYKGIDSFISFLDDKGILDQYRILIAGKISSEDLSRRIHSFLSKSSNLVLMPEFLPEQDLMFYIKHSKIVLFTYHSASVLSSGALMDSLSQEATIFGPHTGAFEDLSRLDLVHTFENYEDLITKIDIHLASEFDLDRQKERIAGFNNENTWENYANQIELLISKYLNF